MSKSVKELQGPVRAFFSDLDGTMSTDGRLSAPVLESLNQLATAGLPLVLVTGRPAGWGHALASLFPFSAVITENGGVSFVAEGGSLRKVMPISALELRGWRKRMDEATCEVTQKFPEARLSGDSAYREVDLAIDWNEEVHMEAAQADCIVDMLREHGLAASRSSVHVNFGPPGIDKWKACERVLETCFSGIYAPYDEVVYLGDSLNDAPVFSALRHSVGVANVKDRWAELSDKPGYLCVGREGDGFCELAQHLLLIMGNR